MKTFEELDKAEKSLLLFLEACAVDKWGKMDMRHVNAEDVAIMDGWKKEGFICYGRIAFEDIRESGGDHLTHWVRLGDAATDMALRERKERATRVWAKRVWKTTEEARSSKTRRAVSCS